MNLPKRRKREPMRVREPGVIRCPSFLAYVRRLECSAVMTNWQGCAGATEAAHVRSGTDGGVGMKPSDRYALPLCSCHHRRQHQIGEGPFEKEARIDMRAIADGLWAQWLKTSTGRDWLAKNPAIQVATSSAAETLAAKTPKDGGDE